MSAHTYDVTVHWRDPAGAHWLLPIDPAAHLDHQPADWRTRADATAVWEAIGRSQPIERWCLRSGYRTMRAGDTIWAYLSKRQEISAQGVVTAVVSETDREQGDGDVRWFVEIYWDADVTRRLCRNPLPRSAFGQVPMSTCRATTRTLDAVRAHVA